MTTYLADTTEIEFRKVTVHSRHSHGCTVDYQGHQLGYHIVTGESKEKYSSTYRVVPEVLTSVQHTSREEYVPVGSKTDMHFNAK